MVSILQHIIDAILRFLSPSMSEAEVAKQLDARNIGQSEQLDWRHSIVDLMKLLKIDSSLSARQALAAELGYVEYDGQLDGSEKMNLWLHKEVLAKVSDHGIRIPTT